jgi:hypothetical protein
VVITGYRRRGCSLRSNFLSQNDSLYKEEVCLDGIVRSAVDQFISIEKQGYQSIKAILSLKANTFMDSSVYCISLEVK